MWCSMPMMYAIHHWSIGWHVVEMWWESNSGITVCARNTLSTLFMGSCIHYYRKFVSPPVQRPLESSGVKNSGDKYSGYHHQNIHRTGGESIFHRQFFTHYACIYESAVIKSFTAGLKVEGLSKRKRLETYGLICVGSSRARLFALKGIVSMIPMS